jgi:ATP-dependent Clp protease ATP-binding subunit ClpA
MTDIVEIQLNRLRKLLADRKVEVKFDSKALQWLANRGYDPVYGARPLKRVIQRSLQNRWPRCCSKARSGTATPSRSASRTASLRSAASAC